MSDWGEYLKIIPDGLSTAKAAVDLTKALRDLVKSDGGGSASKEIQTQIQDKLFELTEKNLHVQEDYGKLLEFARALQRRVEELESFDEAARGLVLTEVGLHSWAYCTSVADNASPRGPFFCQSCHTVKRLTVLQLEKGHAGGHDRLGCPVCKATVMVKNDRTIPAASPGRTLRSGWMAR